MEIRLQAALHLMDSTTMTHGVRVRARLLDDHVVVARYTVNTSSLIFVGLLFVAMSNSIVLRSAHIGTISGHIVLAPPSTTRFAPVM